MDPDVKSDTQLPPHPSAFPQTGTSQPPQSGLARVGYFLRTLPPTFWVCRRAVVETPVFAIVIVLGGHICAKTYRATRALSFPSMSLTPDASSTNVYKFVPHDIRIVCHGCIKGTQ